MVTLENHTPILTLNEATKRFGRDEVGVGPVTLQLYPGEGVALCGRNGAGKSTLLKLMAGIYRPDQGNCWRSPQLTGKVGYIPQDLALYHSLSGLDNLYFWGNVYGLRGKALRARSWWLLDLLELTDKAKKAVETYSGGMQRRLHLASALMITPRLLLLDEPTVGADFHSSQLILKLLLHMRQRGCCIVFISHHPTEVQQLCSRMLILDEGILSEERLL